MRQDPDAVHPQDLIIELGDQASQVSIAVAVLSQ
jgi:hypothetical protein